MPVHPDLVFDLFIATFLTFAPRSFSDRPSNPHSSPAPLIEIGISSFAIFELKMENTPDSFCEYPGLVVFI